MSRKLSKDFTIVVAGQAGQGIESVASVLAHVLKRQGYHTYVSKDVMSRIRGGMNSLSLRVANKRSDAYRAEIDLFVPLDPRAYAHYRKRFTPETIFLGVAPPEDISVDREANHGSAEMAAHVDIDGGGGMDPDVHHSMQKQAKEDVAPNSADVISIPREVIKVNFLQIAHEVGNRIYANTVAAGTILGMLDTDKDLATHYLRSFFIRKGQDVVDQNITAFEKGYTIGRHAAFQEDISVALTPKNDVEDYIFLSGAEAVGFGALAGGCDFISSYPMSPATGVLTFLAQNGKECGVVVEQATDEIGAINMSLGASFAGARSLVTTSGGGFDLMTESISLSAITETPIVVHLAQRPGPATGLPTRTGQEDLVLARHGGHGEFMRAIYAPGTPEQLYALTARALDRADRFQIPVFVLSDQLLMDSYFCAPSQAFAEQNVTKHFIETDHTYKRYRLTEDGVSLRGIPGHGDGLVHVDSDEHDEDGRITEDMDYLRRQMMDKRYFKRKKLLIDDAIAPDIIGKKDAKKIVISWGSNKRVVEEAVANLNDEDVSSVHFTQVYPLHSSVKDLIGNADQIAVVENNATGQFADILEEDTREVVTDRVLKWNGEPFGVEELTRTFKEML